MNKLLSNISFTKNESKVIIFIILVLITGLTIRYYRHIFEPDSNLPYDFTKKDSEFRELSQRNNKKRISSATDSSSAEDEILLKRIKEDTSKAEVITEEEITEKININTATKSELVDLPGVGESTADKIIEYREKKISFRKPEELMNVKGIGKKKFEKLKNYIKTE